jgi:hypothetical protein
MESIDIIKVVGAIILGYAALLFTMWLFKRNKKNPENKEKK